ncbi:MAG: hypothetical protein GF334_11000 [Candidatus Altiarchaeales archaeon]|nr:hypothetical protein [Candidatus Altiarchaeales archaeon]
MDAADKVLELTVVFGLHRIIWIWESVENKTPDYTREELFILLDRIFGLGSGEFLGHIPLILSIIRGNAGLCISNFIVLKNSELNTPATRDKVLSCIRDAHAIRYHLTTYRDCQSAEIRKIMFETKFSEMPLYAFKGSAQVIAQWRLEIGK